MDNNPLLQRLQQINQQRRPQTDFAAPPNLDNQIDQMPNSERLTPFERGVYKVLPGFGESTVGKALSRFSESWAGKALNYLDVLAEGAERGIGLLGQMNDPNFSISDREDLQAAWYAGGLTYDMTNLPTLKRDGNGSVVGLTIPNDLPDIGGLSTARTRIKELIAGGMDPGEALKMAREEYYSSLGALGLRAQLHDTYGHILLDPLNIVTAYVKPVEFLQMRRFAAMTRNIGYTAEELVTKADELNKLAKLATDAGEAAKYADEANEVLRISQKITTGEFKGLDTVDKFAIMLTGGDPFRPTRFAQAISKVPILNMFQLTPESKAKELISLLSDNVGVGLIQNVFNKADAEEQFVKALDRIEKGSVGLEYGHALASMEGRTVQGFLRGSSVKVKEVFRAYSSDVMKGERGLLKVLSETLGEESAKLLKRAVDNPDALLRQIANKGDPLMMQLLQSGELNADRLATMARSLKGLPYNKEMFFAYALDAIEEHAMRQAVVQFGVKARGTMTRWSEAMKSAESLAFLRLNPAYPIRNKINNDITMIARGVFGLATPGMIDDFKNELKLAGFVPTRFGEGFTQAEVAGTNIKKAGDILEEALKGGNYGVPEKAKEFFQQINLGKADTASWGRSLETAASWRATYNGWKQYWRQFYKPKRFAEIVDSKTLDAVANAAPDFAREFDNAVRSAGDSVDKLDELLRTNLNLNVDSVLDNVGEALGTDAREMLGTEVLEFLHKNLPEAMKAGTTEKMVLEARQVVDRHIEDLFNKQLENVIEHVKAQVTAGGPQTFYKYAGEAQDIFWRAHSEHAFRMPSVTDALRREPDAKVANALWNKLAEDDRKFFDRAFRRVDAYGEAMEQAAKEMGLPFPKQVRQFFKEWKKGWEGFFEKTGAEKRAFFDAKLTGTEYKKAWEQLTAENQAAFDAMAAREDVLMQQIDDVIANQISDPAVRTAFTNSRDALAELRRTEKQKVTEIFGQIQDLPAAERQKVWDQFWAERQQLYAQMWDVDSASRAIAQGDPNAMQMFSQAAPREAGAAETIFDTANKYGISSASPSGTRNDRRILNTVNKYLPEGTPKFKNVEDIPEDIARQAFEARAAEKGIQAQAGAQGPISRQFIGDISKIVPDPMPIDLSTDLMSYGRTYGALDMVVDGARRQADKTPLIIEQLPENLRAGALRAIEDAKREISSHRYTATRFAEWRRDSALLNYNRRTNFDAMVGNVFPYAFWTTGSMQKWAIESIDRPAALTTYLRMQKLLETSGLQNDGMPSRARGNIRISLPGAPEWMGEQFVDPLRLLFPFKGFAQPFEQMQQAQASTEGRATRLLDGMLSSGQITQAEYDEAVDSKNTPVWDRAMSEAQQNDDNQKFDAWDFATAMSSPHAPIMWAYNAASGHPENIGPFAPVSRLMRNAATMMGVEDWNNSSWNVEAKLRKQMGLPAFDKWDDYRIDRALSSFAGTGEYSLDEVKEAMYLSSLVQQGKLSPEEAKQMSEVYREGVTRANQEYSGGTAGAILSFFGINVKSLPPGEQNLRRLQDDFGNAYQQYHDANQALEKFIGQHPELGREGAIEAWERCYPAQARNADALKNFFEEHPEYEARLALFDKPEERVRKFMVDQIWQQWNEYPKLNQDEIRDQLGPDFDQAFLNKNTRSYDNLSPEQLSVWLKLMGGNPVGTLTATDQALLSLQSLRLTKPETAYRVQVFYDTRKSTYSDFYTLQNGYYAYETKRERDNYVREHPELREYWDWRRDFMNKNPDLVPYLTDNERDIERARNRHRQEGAVPTAQEISVNLGPEITELLHDYAPGDALDPVVERELAYYAGQYGMTPEQILNIARSQHGQ